MTQVTRVDSLQLDVFWSTLSEGFGHQAPLLDALYPMRGSSEGDIDAVTRLRRRMQGDHMDLHCIQAAISTQISGAAIWSVWTTPPTGDITKDDCVEDPRTVWPSEKDETYARGLWEIYSEGRVRTIREAAAEGRRTWVLEWLSVLPEARGQGVGEALVCWGRDRADKSGDKSITEATEAALHMYQRCGYDVVGNIDFSPIGERFPHKQLPRLTSMRRRGLAELYDRHLALSRSSRRRCMSPVQGQMTSMSLHLSHHASSPSLVPSQPESIPMGPPNPLVLTLTLDKTTQHFLTSLRSKYFPSHRNHLQAHVSLFHAVPAHRHDELDGELSRLCQSISPWEVFVNDPRKMGNRGVMVSVRDRRGSIEWLHRQLLKFLLDGVKNERDDLTGQDKRNWGKTAHVTILNKAERDEEVEKCLKEVTELFEGMKGERDRFGQKVGQAVGIELWEYQGGPWSSIKRYEFEGRAS